MKQFLYVTLSFVLYASAVLIGDALSAGSTFQEGIAHAVFFGSFFTVLTFPMLAGVGFIVRWSVEWLLKRQIPARAILPWFAHVPISLFLLWSILPKTPSELFRHYVSNDVPSSLAELQYWRTSGFGNSIVILSFRIDPAEFTKVLSRYKYEVGSNDEGNPPSLVKQLASDRPAFPISMPRSPLMHLYSYSEPGSGGGFHVRHYVTASKDHVITVQTVD